VCEFLDEQELPFYANNFWDFKEISPPNTQQSRKQDTFDSIKASILS